MSAAVSVLSISSHCSCIIAGSPLCGCYCHSFLGSRGAAVLLQAQVVCRLCLLYAQANWLLLLLPVTGVLQPLRQLLDTPGPVAQLQASLKVLLSRDVIESVNTRYSSLAEELLTTVKKTESSLKRLKKSRPGETVGLEAGGAAAGGAAGMSDSDKICLQLFLDVQEHGRQIVKFGLVPEELESYRQLLVTVTPADRQPDADQ
eukprot:GHUV01039536.1.p1 GENE.GHUV01039536.1~~GHUV01039536.1.p1  ORF type:complete len:203 (-),score=70.56 GHUV01039536.1:182-790(-)